MSSKCCLNNFCQTWHCSASAHHLDIPHNKDRTSMLSSFGKFGIYLDYGTDCIHHYVIFVYCLFGRYFLLEMFYGTWQRTYMTKMDSSPRPNRRGRIGRLKSLQDSSTMSVSGQIHGICWVWLSIHSKHLSRCRWRRMIG